jgi:hypothetical protein
LWQVVPPAGHFDADSYLYDATASYFAATGDMTDPSMPTRAPIQSVGYHFFVGLIYRIVGHKPAAVIVVQVVLMLAVLAYLMRCALLISTPAVAHAAAYGGLLSLGLHIYPQLILAETLLLVLVMICLERFLVFFKQDNHTALVQSYALLALAMIVKPLMLPFVGVISYVAYTKMAYHDKRSAVPTLAVAVGIFMLCIASYMGRNWIKYGQFAFAPMTTLNIYQCYLAKVIAVTEGIREQELVATTLRCTSDNMLDDSGWSDARTLFYAYLYAHPCICVYVWLHNVCKTMVGLYSTQFKRMLNPELTGREISFFAYKGALHERAMAYVLGATDVTFVRILAVLELLLLMCIWLGTLIALHKLYYSDRLLCWVLLGFLVSCFVPTGIDGCCRYRIIAEPILLLLASMTYVRLYTIKRGVVYAIS